MSTNISHTPYSSSVEDPFEDLYWEEEMDARRQASLSRGRKQVNLSAYIEEYLSGDL